MRKHNLNLLEAKLTVKQEQLLAIQNQLMALQSKIDDVGQRYNAKRSEVQEIQNLVNSLKSGESKLN